MAKQPISQLFSKDARTAMREAWRLRRLEFRVDWPAATKSRVSGLCPLWDVATQPFQVAQISSSAHWAPPTPARDLRLLPLPPASRPLFSCLPSHLRAQLATPQSTSPYSSSPDRFPFPPWPSETSGRAGLASHARGPSSSTLGEDSMAANTLSSTPPGPAPHARRPSIVRSFVRWFVRSLSLEFFGRFSRLRRGPSPSDTHEEAEEPELSPRRWGDDGGIY